MTPSELSLPQLNLQILRNELAKRNLLDFVCYLKEDYIVNWHHALLCRYLNQLAKGEINRLMVFIPPQHGKLISNSTPICCVDGWKTHGDIKNGDYVFNRLGEPTKVLAVSDYSQTEYDIEFSDGEIIQCHGNHEWVVYDRSKHKELILETKYLFSQKLRNNIEKKRGNRNRYQVDINTAIEYPEKNLILEPYILGAWLGDGSKGKGCITHHKDDNEVIDKIKQYGYNPNSICIHKITGVITTYFNSLLKQLKQLPCFISKHIPDDYLFSSRMQRLELLAGLIDTDGYVYHKNGRVTFSNTNKRLIDDVNKLVLSLGWRCTVCEFEPKKSTSGIQGKQKVYQLCFNPDCYIPLAINRKKLTNINPAKRKRAIVSITKSINSELGKCIQVEGGVYLVGKTLIPTHNSELVSRMLPAFLLGRNPDTKIVVASYSSDLSSTFNRDCQRIMDSEKYKQLFPETSLNRSAVVSSAGGFLRNSDIFQIVNHTGFFKAVGVGGALTGVSSDVAIIDDPVKDSLEAMSPTYQVRNWNWYNDVLFTRIHNKSKILITQTRWDERDLSGLIIKSMNEGRGEKWTILNLPAIKENNDNLDDPRQIGEALWEERHSIEKLKMIQRSSLRTFQSLYQQNPQPVETGGEFYNQFKIWRNVKDYEYNPELPLHISFDFNVNPGMHLGVFQVSGKCAWMLKEIFTESPRNNTIGACNEFKRLFSNHTGGLFIYGDPSGKNKDTRQEQGFNDYNIIIRELRDFHPTLRVANSHPAVRMRGNFINSIFESQIYGLEIWIHSKCTKTIEDLTFIKEDSDGTKLKEKAKDLTTGVIYEKYGHCFVAGTKIITSKGKKSIEKIKSGDLVLTRKGFKKVIQIFDNGFKEVKSYRIGKYKLTCTPDHKIYANDDFHSIAHLIESNIVCIFDKKKIWKKKLSITEDIILSDTLIHLGGLIEFIIWVTLRLGVNIQRLGYMFINGFVRLAKYLKDIAFTIKMKIHLIMNYLIWNVSREVFIQAGICQPMKTENEALKHLENMHNQKQQNGIEAHVPSAEKNMTDSQHTQALSNIAAVNVNHGLLCEKTGNLENGMKKEYVQSVAKNLKFTNGLKKKHVQGNVQQVYDLQIEDCHEYFANNILVHNCSDFLDYFICECFKKDYQLYQNGGLKLSPGGIMTVGRQNRNVG